MKMFFRYMRTDLKRALEEAGFWLSIAAVAVAGLLYLIEELDSYLDVIYVFHQAIYGSMFFLNYIFTAIPCASLLVEDWETGYYRPAMVRGGLISYGIAKAAVIFTIPSAVLAAGNFLFLLILKVRLPWMGSVGSQVAGVVGERVAGTGSGNYLSGIFLEEGSGKKGHLLAKGGMNMQTGAQVAIEVLSVDKKFGSFSALSGVSVICEPGKIYGLTGRNGSGKSVLLKCICGFLIPDAGKIRIFGKTKKRGEMLREAGIIIEEPAFLGKKSGIKNLEYLYGIRNRMDRKRLEETMLQVGLDPGERKPVEKYSLGMRQRLAIAQALMEDPQILILDEYLNGLDRQGAKEIRALLLSWKERGKTILLTSHSREDMEILCDQVFEMDGGKLFCRKRE